MHWDPEHSLYYILVAVSGGIQENVSNYFRDNLLLACVNNIQLCIFRPTYAYNCTFYVTHKKDLKTSFPFIFLRK